VDNGCRRVVYPRSMFNRRMVRWHWQDCTGHDRSACPWTDSDGRIIWLGDPPHACTTGPDFTCPIHPRPEPIAL